MKTRTIAASVGLIIAASFPSGMQAQEISAQSRYNNDCRPLSPEELAIERENILLQLLAPLKNTACERVERIRNLVRKTDDPDKIDANDVFDASKPNITARSNPYGIPEGLSDADFKKRLAQAKYRARNPNWRAEEAANARRQSNPANEAVTESNARDEQQLHGDPVLLPPATPGGTPVVFQPAEAGGLVPTKLSEIGGTGTLIGADGMKKGTFKNGKLNGYGEEIDPDGTWRGGTYDRGTNVQSMFEVRKVDGKTYLAVGDVVNGKLDGMVERVFADGSTQFEDWENGKLMQVGNRAPKGQTALAPKTRQQPVEVAETEDAYKHTGPRTKIAPGTTFDPARTTQGSTTQKLASGPYRNQIKDPILPASFYSRYTAQNLAPAECNRQSDALGWRSKVDAVNASGNLILQLRGIAAEMEALLVISRQCENTPGAQAELDNFARQRTAAIENCLGLSNDSAICRKSPY